MFGERASGGCVSQRGRTHRRSSHRIAKSAISKGASGIRTAPGSPHSHGWVTWIIRRALFLIEERTQGAFSQASGCGLAFIVIALNCEGK